MNRHNFSVIISENSDPQAVLEQLGQLLGMHRINDGNAGSIRFRYQDNNNDDVLNAGDAILIETQANNSLTTVLEGSLRSALMPWVTGGEPGTAAAIGALESANDIRHSHYLHSAMDIGERLLALVVHDPDPSTPPVLENIRFSPYGEPTETILDNGNRRVFGGLLCTTPQGESYVAFYETIYDTQGHTLWDNFVAIGNPITGVQVATSTEQEFDNGLTHIGLTPHNDGTRIPD